MFCSILKWEEQTWFLVRTANLWSGSDSEPAVSHKSPFQRKRVDVHANDDALFTARLGQTGAPRCPCRAHSQNVCWGRGGRSRDRTGPGADVQQPSDLFSGVSLPQTNHLQNAPPCSYDADLWPLTSDPPLQLHGGEQRQLSNDNLRLCWTAEMWGIVLLNTEGLWGRHRHRGPAAGHSPLIRPPVYEVLANVNWTGEVCIETDWIIRETSAKPSNTNTVDRFVTQLFWLYHSLHNITMATILNIQIQCGRHFLKVLCLRN